MKENKFRVYCEFEFEGKITKCMESPASWFLMTQTGKLWTYDPGEAPRPLAKEYKKAIPLFYTGLKDKNGKEIYIGDILLLNNKNYDPKDDIYYEGRVIIRETEYLGYTFEPIDPISEPFDSTSMWHVGEEDTTEIIGNIYENPELLRVA